MTILTKDSARTKKVEALQSAAVAYADFTETTAKYPTSYEQLVGNSAVSVGLLYCVLGVSNEVGELAELFDQEAMHDGNRNERYAAAWKELGDVQWYIARTCAELPDDLPTFDALVMRAYASLKDEVRRELRLSGFDLQSGLCAHAGRALGVVKKMMRDGATWSPEKRTEKVGELREALFCMVRLSVDFAERTGPLVACDGGYVNLLRANADKLQDRKDRGVLQGDGDAR